MADNKLVFVVSDVTKNSQGVLTPESEGINCRLHDFKVAF